MPGCAYVLLVSTAELKRIVDDATPEQCRFLFVCLSEKLHGYTDKELGELDNRLSELDSGKKRLSLAEFEKRLNHLPSHNEPWLGTRDPRASLGFF